MEGVGRSAPEHVHCTRGFVLVVLWKKWEDLHLNMWTVPGVCFGGVMEGVGRSAPESVSTFTNVMFVYHLQDRHATLSLK